MSSTHNDFTPHGDDLSAWLALEGSSPIAIQGNCAIGRSVSNQVCLPSDKVSRRHALVHSQDQDQYWLVDLGSSNGTFLNGRRVTQPVQLKDKDQIDISTFRILFHQSSKAPISDPFQSGDTLREIKVSTCWLLLGDIEGSTQLIKKFAPAEVASMTGRWLAECKQIIEESGGSVNKFLGDGFFAYWRERERITISVARSLEALKRLQKLAQPPFRLVVHYGSVYSGGGASMGEESLSGPEVNFVFRMEKLAAPLGVNCIASKAAADQLIAVTPIHELGPHPVQSFDGTFQMFKF